MLQTLDSLWKERLRWTICVRVSTCVAMHRKDPKQEYKRESFSMFAAMLESLKYGSYQHAEQSSGTYA